MKKQEMKTLMQTAKLLKMRVDNKMKKFTAAKENLVNLIEEARYELDYAETIAEKKAAMQYRPLVAEAQDEMAERKLDVQSAIYDWRKVMDRVNELRDEISDKKSIARYVTNRIETISKEVNQPYNWELKKDMEDNVEALSVARDKYFKIRDELTSLSKEKEQSNFIRTNIEEAFDALLLAEAYADNAIEDSKASIAKFRGSPSVGLRDRTKIHLTSVKASVANMQGRIDRISNDIDELKGNF